MISIIVAVSDDYGIGKDNDLLWHIPEDMRRFRKLTMGKTIIMGKRTWESLPKKPLPGRNNIVITDIPGECIDCSVTAYSIEDALSKCRSEEEVFVIGGGSVYRQFMPIADRLYITHVHKKAPADIYFPKIDKRRWRIIEKEEYISEDDKKIPYSYVIYERKGTGK
ncbi:MAG TPA: dihydrofolate reductase [Bacteroidales bacterium]|jgi:dihydrofolate reductase|nr:dihydrofolate reductase [Bacteroidales bacterium]